MTVCGECIDLPLPNFGLLETVARIGEHCEHLGIDLDEMPAATQHDPE